MNYKLNIFCLLIYKFSNISTTNLFEFRMYIFQKQQGDELVAHALAQRICSALLHVQNAREDVVSAISTTLQTLLNNLLDPVSHTLGELNILSGKNLNVSLSYKNRVFSFSTVMPECSLYL